MLSIPIPEGFQMEGREDGSPFEMTVTGRIQDGEIYVDAVEGIEIAKTDEPEEDVEMDEEALMSAANGGGMA